jgi:hypothetical protein
LCKKPTFVDLNSGLGVNRKGSWAWRPQEFSCSDNRPGIFNIANFGIEEARNLS